MFQDKCGTIFTTINGQPPIGSQNVTIFGNGTSSPGYWNGDVALRY